MSRLGCVHLTFFSPLFCNYVFRAQIWACFEYTSPARAFISSDASGNCRLRDLRSVTAPRPLGTEFYFVYVIIAVKPVFLVKIFITHQQQTNSDLWYLQIVATLGH